MVLEKILHQSLMLKSENS